MVLVWFWRLILASCREHFLESGVLEQLYNLIGTQDTNLIVCVAAALRNLSFSGMCYCVVLIV